MRRGVENWDLGVRDEVKNNNNNDININISITITTIAAR